MPKLESSEFREIKGIKGIKGVKGVKGIKGVKGKEKRRAETLLLQLFEKSSMIRLFLCEAR